MTASLPHHTDLCRKKKNASSIKRIDEANCTALISGAENFTGQRTAVKRTNSNATLGHRTRIRRGEKPETHMLFGIWVVMVQ